MKHLVLKTLLFLLLPAWVSAQSTVMQSAEEEPEEPKTKILVIPFHQIRYYFSDCDKQIAERNKMQLPEVRQSFMLGMDYATENRLDKKFEPLNLVQMRDSIDKAYFQQFYENVSYTYDAPDRLLTKKQNAVMKKVEPNRKTLGQNNKKSISSLSDSENYTDIQAEDDKYMRLNWAKPEFLSALAATYEPEYIITINQFEIKTNYQKCIDRELGKYARTIKIHYNVFKPTGEMVYGDVVSAHYNSTSDDINAIIQDNFGLLADYVYESLPGRKPSK